MMQEFKGQVVRNDSYTGTGKVGGATKQNKRLIMGSLLNSYI